MKKTFALLIATLSLGATELEYRDSLTVIEKAEVRKSEQKVSILDTVSRATIEKNPEANIIDLLDGTPGVQKKIDCSVCNTAQIKLMGLNGTYSQILVNDLPVFSGLGTTYGIEQMPLVTADRIEIIKGASGVQHGNSAIAGVINVVQGPISQDPTCYLKMNYGHHNEQQYEGSFSSRIPNTGTGLEIGFSYHNSPLIDNDSSTQMIDVAEFDRVSFAARISQFLGDKFELTAKAQVQYEDRFGGTHTSDRSTIGSYTPDSSWVNHWGDTIKQEVVYQEYVRTKRVQYEMGLTTYMGDYLRNESRVNYLQHFQESWYGYLDLRALQDLLYLASDFIWELDKNEILGGVTYTYDAFIDNRSIGIHTNHIPALYVQDLFAPSEKWDIMGGLRFDHHSVHGPIFSPRFATSFYGMKNFIWKLSAGRGFRTFNLFSENHSAITSEVYYLEPVGDLDPETSWSFTLNGEYAKTFHKNFSLAAEATIYHTRIDDYIQSTYKKEYTQDGRQKVAYQNLDGTILTEGVEGVLTLKLPLSLTVEGGGNLFNYRSKGNSTKKFAYFAPEYTALAGIDWNSEKLGLSIGADMNYVGPQLLREVRFGEKTLLPERKSPAFAIVDAQIEKSFGSLTLSLAMQNIGDFCQSKEEPIFFTDGWYYQTTSVWGPMKGRTLYAGIRYNGNFSKK